MSTCELRTDYDRSFHGHLNWFDVTFVGPLFFEERSDLGAYADFKDKDLNFALGTPGAAALTPANVDQRFIVLEMDHNETADLWGSPWWSRLASGIMAPNPAAGAAMISGHTAWVSGLFGLDGVHEFHSELHPVYSVAINEQLDRRATADTWAVFARRSGDEGYCSHKNPHVVAALGDTLRVELPWFPGATDVNADTSSTSFVLRGAGTTFLGLEVDTKTRRVAVAFVMPASTAAAPSPADRPLADGEIRLKWAVPATIAQSVSGSAVTAPSRPSKDEAEEASLRAIRSLSSAERSSLLNSIRRTTVPPAGASRGSLVRPKSGATLGNLMRQQISLPVEQPSPTITGDNVRDSIIAAALCKKGGVANSKAMCSKGQ